MSPRVTIPLRFPFCGVLQANVAWDDHTLSICMRCPSDSSRFRTQLELRVTKTQEKVRPQFRHLHRASAFATTIGLAQRRVLALPGTQPMSSNLSELCLNLGDAA